MKINTKISEFLEKKGISQKEIAESYGGTVQNISNILNRDTGKVPFDFLIWLANNHPELNLNSILETDTQNYLVHEERATYGNSVELKSKIMSEVRMILDKYL